MARVLGRKLLESGDSNGFIRLASLLTVKPTGFTLKLMVPGWFSRQARTFYGEAQCNQATGNEPHRKKPVVGPLGPARLDRLGAERQTLIDCPSAISEARAQKEH